MFWTAEGIVEEDMNFAGGGIEIELRWAGKKSRGIWGCLFFVHVVRYGVNSGALG